MKKYLIIAAFAMFAAPAMAYSEADCKHNPSLCQAPASGTTVKNTNTNVAVAGAVAAASNSITLNSTESASTAAAPSISTGDDCGIGLGLGYSSVITSQSAGVSIPGKKCVVRKEVELLYDMGYRSAAIRHWIMNDDRIARTFEEGKKEQAAAAASAPVAYKKCFRKDGKLFVVPNSKAVSEIAHAQCAASGV